MAYFEDEPPYLIGRSAVMASATAALGDQGKAGVIFSGPPGIGKTACAVELAYRFESEFGKLVYWSAAGRGVAGSLKSFAQAMETQLPEFTMAAEVETAEKLHKFLPKLTELMKRMRILVLIDGIDGQLTSGGRWHEYLLGIHYRRDAQPSGFSRLLLTGCRPLASAPNGLAAAPLEPLTGPESVLFARQLPVLGALMRGTSGLAMPKARLILAEELSLAAGNPAKILERDKRLTGADLAHLPAGAIAPSPVYTDLVGRWTYEAG